MTDIKIDPNVPDAPIHIDTNVPDAPAASVSSNTIQQFNPQTQTAQTQTQTVPLFGPDNQIYDVPSDKAKDAVAAGGSIASPIIAPDGSHMFVPATKLHDALKAGAKIDDTGWTPEQERLQHRSTVGAIADTVVGQGTIGADVVNRWNKPTPIDATNPANVHEELSKPLVKFSNAVTPDFQKNHPIITGLMETADGLTSPENVALMFATEGLGTLSGAESKLAANALPRVLSAGFSIQQLIDAGQKVPQIWDAIKRGDESEALHLTTLAVTETGMAALGVQHAAGIEATPSTRTGKAIGNVVDAAASRTAQAFRSDSKAMATANAAHRAANVIYDQRLNEHEIMTDQAIRAAQAADEAKVKFSNNEITAKQLDEAQTTASEAAANAGKATKALADAHENLATAGAEVDRMTDKLTRSRQTSNVKQDKKVAAAVEDFKRMAPPTTGRQGQYSDKDLQIALGYAEKEHENNPIQTVQDHADAFQKISDDIDDEVGQHIQKYGKDPITTNVKMDVRDKLAESPQVTFVEDGLNYLSENFNLTDPSLAEAQKILTDMNALNRGTLKKNFWDVATALRSDPEFAARYYAADSLRNGIDGALVDRGVQGVRELRRDQSSIIRVKTAVEKQVTKGGQRVRGSGASGALRLAGKFAASTGVGVGAGIGAGVTHYTGMPGATEAGAIAGGYIGNKIGERIAPNDYTRDELAARVHQVSGKGVPTTELDVAGKPAGQYGPPDAVSPLMQMYTPQREFTPLHSALASHFGEVLGKSSYVDLEQRFLDDIQRKQDHNLPPDPADKKILAQLNDQNMSDYVQAQKQIQDQQAQGKTPATATLPEKVDPLLRLPDSVFAEGMDTHKGIVHDLAHIVVGNQRGITFDDGVRSHMHPENVREGGLMSAPIDWSEFMDKDGNMDPMKLRTRMADIAATYVAGGVSNDLYHNIPFTENHHLGADVKSLKGLMVDVGFTPSEASKMIAQAADDAAQILGKPGVQTILEDHAAVREHGLDDKYHVSPERVEQILQDLKEGTDASSTGKSARTNGQNEGAGKGTGAGTKAINEEGDSTKLRQKKQGPAEGEGGSVRQAEPSKQSEPAATDTGRRATGLGKAPEEFAPITRPEGGWKNPKVDLPPEQTTGQYDKAIKEAGAIPGGIAEGDKEYNEPNLVQFHDPNTGSTLALPTDQVTPDNIRRELEKSREQFAAGEKKTPTSPKLDEDEDQLLVGERQTPLKRNYKIEIINQDGTSHTENIPGFSTKDALKTAQKKFPESSHWAIQREGQVGGLEGEPMPAPDKYTIPDKKALTFGARPSATRTDSAVEIHELGHAMVGANEGQTHMGMYRHTHPDMPGNARAAVAWDLRNLKDPITGYIKADKVPSVIRGLMGGAAADEVFSNLDRRQNHNLAITANGSDGNVSYKILKTAGFSHDDSMALIDTAIDQAKQHLTQPDVSDIIKENLQKREANLSRQFHYSPERLNQMHQEAIRRINARNTNNQGTGGEGTQGPTGNVPGAEGGSPQATPGAVPESPKLGGLREQTTGDPEHDQIIKDAGAVPAGVMFPGTDLAIKMFHDPQTGTTLGFKPTEAVTPESVSQKLADSRSAYGIKQPENPQLAAQKSPEDMNRAELKTELGVTGDDPRNGLPNKVLQKQLEQKRGISSQKPDWWSEPSDNKFAQGMTKGEEIQDWLTRHKVPQENGKYVLYHATPVTGGATDTIRAGSLLAEDPDTAVHQASRERGAKAGDIKVGKILINPEDIKPGVWASVRNDHPVAEWGTPRPAQKFNPPEAPQLGKPELRVSTRVPSGKEATENHMGDNPLEIDRATLAKAPEKLQQKFADKIREVPGVKIPKNINDIGKVYDRAIGQLSDHLKWLYNQETPENRVNNAKWYESAHNMTQKWANDMGYNHEQIAGALASLSPQTEWDLNVSQAKRLIDIHKNHQDAIVDPSLIKTAHDIIDRSRKGGNKTANADLEGLLDDIKGKKISDLTGLHRAAAVRLYDETHNPRTFHRIDPATGNEMEVRTNANGQPTRAGWGNFSNMEKALSILDDGSRKNISDQVGDSHKVRNFYNNIIDPSHPRDVTMDTHAVGAATLTPMSGNTKEVTDNFGGAGSHAGTGITGTYPLFAEAYRKAANDLGIKARELQSVTWEKVRDMFPAEWKTKENMAAVRKEWKRYNLGKQDLGTTRQNILDMSEQGKKQAGDRQQIADRKQQAKLVKSGNQSGIDALGAK